MEVMELKHQWPPVKVNHFIQLMAPMAKSYHALDVCCGTPQKDIKSIVTATVRALSSDSCFAVSFLSLNQTLEVTCFHFNISNMYKGIFTLNSFCTFVLIVDSIRNLGQPDSGLYENISTFHYIHRI